jgi:hypothetical protein
MKASLLPLGALLLAAMPLSHAGPRPERADGPCFRVTVQNDRVNESTVRQDCERNVSRTVQAGARNEALTIQSGRVNDNRVRQYSYDADRYLERTRGR